MKDMKSKDLFEILMRENADMLLAYLRATVRDSHAVDDLFQETMIVAWKKLSSFDQQRAFGAWLRGIAGNLVLAHFRRQGKAASSLESSTLEWLESRFAKIQQINGDTFEDKLVILRECLDALPENYRGAIDKRYEEGKSLAELSQDLGEALDTIKKRLYRARAQLGQCVETKLLAMERVS